MLFFSLFSLLLLLFGLGFLFCFVLFFGAVKISSTFRKPQCKIRREGLCRNVVFFITEKLRTLPWLFKEYFSGQIEE